MILSKYAGLTSTVETAVDIEQLLKDVAGKLNPILCNEFGDEIWGLFQLSIT